VKLVATASLQTTTTESIVIRLLELVLFQLTTSLRLLVKQVRVLVLHRDHKASELLQLLLVVAVQLLLSQMLHFAEVFLKCLHVVSLTFQKAICPLFTHLELDLKIHYLFFLLFDLGDQWVNPLGHFIVDNTEI